MPAGSRVTKSCAPLSMNQTCPPSITVQGKRFTNFEGESGPGASFRDDFTHSCNAAFISLAPRLPGGAVTSAARQFGFGSRWQLPLASYSGEAPPPADPVERAAEMIGQGRVLASPLNMALVAEGAALVKDAKESRSLEVYKQNMEGMAKALPVEERFRQSNTGSGNVLEVVNVVRFSGDFNAGLTLNGTPATDTISLDALTLNTGTGSLSATGNAIDAVQAAPASAVR